MSGFNLSEWSIRNPSLVVFFMIGIVVSGTLSFLKLGRAEDPVFTIRTMVVQAQWPGATLEISPTDRTSAWGDIAAAAEAWTPERAAAHQARARAAVDWRWRLVDLCRALGWDDAQARAVAATRLLATSDC